MATARTTHATVEANGVRLHVARRGRGRPLLLLHGWPEFWRTWEPLMERLSDRFDLLAPDFRGFGESEKPDPGPSDRATAAVHAADLLALLDALGLDRVGVVAHDVGASVTQVLARRAPERLAGLALFDCPYPGIGPRWAAPDHLKEIWYQSFHQTPVAAAVVGASREACSAYIGHFLSHWAAGNPEGAFDAAAVEAWTENFMRPGNLQGGFNWYIGAAEERLRVIRGESPALPPIAVPTLVRWGALDPILRVAWADRLGETFADLDVAPFEGVGHFPHREAPDRAAAEVAAFFDRRWPAP